MSEYSGKYQSEAYQFVKDALVKTADKSEKRHISGQELLQGIKELALQQFGPLAKLVLNEWNIYSTEDFGNIVFELVESGKLGKTDDDKIEDFANGYDFDEVFSRPFMPISNNSSRKDSKTNNL